VPNNKILNCFDESAAQYYDKFTIGLVTTTGREHLSYSLYRTLKLLWPTIPVTIILNKEASIEKLALPAEWGQLGNDLIITNELEPLTKCRNALALQYPDKPYIIWLDDDVYILTPRAIDSLILAHVKYNVDIVRGFANAAVSMFKGALVEVPWWDERIYFPWTDPDFYERCARKNIPRIDFDAGSIFFHWRAPGVCNYTKEPLEGFSSKYNGPEYYKQKWGVSDPNISQQVQLLEDIDWYPEYTEKFKQFVRLQ